MTLSIDIQSDGIDLFYGKRGPSVKQTLFRDDPNLNKLYGGAVGGGKTVALCAEALRLSLAFPGNRGFMCRHESTAFKNTTLTTLLKLIGEIEDLTKSKIMSNHHRTDKKIYLINGSSILYGSLGDAQDFERIKSLEIGWFTIDEASETPHQNYQMLKSRLRWTLPDGTHPPYFGLLASNPEPGWVKDTFVTPQTLGEPLFGHSFIQALPSDNPYLPSDYVTNLRRDNPASWVDRYLAGNWTAMEGQIWPEFDYQIHTIDPFKVPSGWKKFRSIDHGQVHPTACLWFAIDPDGNIFIYKEYYRPGIVSAHCKSIKELSKGEHYSYTLLPPECWGKTRERAGELWSIKDEYWEHGRIACTKANNSVEVGLNRVGEYLRVNPERVHPRTGEKGSPSLFIFRNCKNLILEIPEYTWKREVEGKEKVKEAPKKIKDDACDALRYGIMSRPHPSVIERTSTPYNSFKYHLAKLTRPRYSGGYVGARNVR